MHPTEEELQHFLEDPLDLANDDAIDQHLSRCATCQARIESMIDATFNHKAQRSVVVGSSHTSEVEVVTLGDELDLGFVLLNEIDRGGMGVVYRAFDRELNREVAIKVSNAASRGTSSVRFRREAQISAQIEHPGIVPVHETGRLRDGRQFIAMKLIKGKTLSAVIKDREESQQAAHYFQVFNDICNTMAFAHSREIIHRDLKPDNVMVGMFGEVQIMDWGLARRLEGKSDIATEAKLPKRDTVSASALDTASAFDTTKEPVPAGTTRPGEVFGTPAYMAPEQARGDHADKRTDVFAIGGILYEILCGQPPFDAPTASVALTKSADNDLAAAFQRLDASEADNTLIALVKSCLAADPDDRPSDAQAISTQFANYLAGREQELHDARLEKVRATERLLSQQKRNRQTIVYSAVIISVLLAAAVASSMYFNEKNARIADQLQLDRDQLQEQTRLETEVRKGIANASQLQLLAKLESEQGETDKWIQAVNEIDKAEPLLANLTNDDLKKSFRSLQNDIRVSAAESSKIKTYLQREQACYEEVKSCCIKATNNPEVRAYIDYRVPERLKTAFESIGIAQNDLSDDVVRRLQNSKYQADLLFGLQTWGTELTLQAFGYRESIWARKKTENATIQWIRDLIAKVDHDPFRQQVRDALLEADRTRLRKLIESDDSTDSLATVRTCLDALCFVNNLEAQLAWTLRAHQEYPMDFFVNWSIANIAGPMSDHDRKLRHLPIQHNLVCYSLQPNHVNVMIGISGTYIMDGKHKMAIEILQRLTQITPKLPFIHLNLAIANMRLGDQELALQHCDKALTFRENQNAFTFLTRGEIHQRLENLDAALADKLKAIELEPNDHSAHAQAAEIYQLNGQVEKAIELMERALELQPSGVAYRTRLSQYNSRLVELYQNEGKVKESIQILKRSLELDPQNTRLQMQLGHTYTSTNELGLALKTFQALVKKNKNEVEAIAMIAKVLRKQGKAAKSEKLLRSAIYDGTNSHQMQLQLAKSLLAQASEENDTDKEQEGKAILQQLSVLAPELPVDHLPKETSTETQSAGHSK